MSLTFLLKSWTFRMHLKLCSLSCSVVLRLVSSTITHLMKPFLRNLYFLLIPIYYILSLLLKWSPNVCIYQPRSLTTRLHHPLGPLLFTLGSVVQLPSRSPGSVADYDDDDYDDDGIFCMECSLTVMQKSILSSSTPLLLHWPPLSNSKRSVVARLSVSGQTAPDCVHVLMLAAPVVPMEGFPCACSDTFPCFEPIFLLKTLSSET